MFRILQILALICFFVSVIALSLAVAISIYFWIMFSILLVASFVIRYFADNITKEFLYILNKDNFLIKRITFGNGTKDLVKINLKQINSLAKLSPDVVNFNSKKNIIFGTNEFENALEITFKTENVSKSILFSPDKFMISLLNQNYKMIKEGKINDIF